MDGEVDNGNVKMVPQVLMWEKRLVRAAEGEPCQKTLVAARGVRTSHSLRSCATLIIMGSRVLGPWSTANRSRGPRGPPVRLKR